MVYLCIKYIIEIIIILRNNRVIVTVAEDLPMYTVYQSDIEIPPPVYTI
jgi:hypothetical protein